jgi:oligopeptide/dipeptide ABC transporter ATP-binding protein
MVFQDPMGSLDPRMKIRDSVSEPLLIAGVGTRKERYERAREMLEIVGLNGDGLERYPHEFSGGQRQRICIARALTLRPDFIVADEPVSALDVSVRAQIINLFQDIQQQFGLAYLFISHDLGVVRHIADEVAVMYLGRVVEKGGAREVLKAPLHPYTKALVAAVPPVRPGTARPRVVLEGDLPSPLNAPKGCAFHTRCPIASHRCREETPALRNVDDGHLVACHLV